MFGIEDTYVSLAYLLCILSALLCVIYGAINWNRGDEPVDSADVRWATRQQQETTEEL
jgi:hypothetical protein